jgi:hypothetical protein
VRRFPNLNEYFVHHEDVRRANGFGPRTNPSAEDATLFRNVTRARRLLSRRLRGAGLALEWAGQDKVISAWQGQPTARLTGLPGELLLFLFGRRYAADVEITDPLRPSKPYSGRPSGCDAQPNPTAVVTGAELCSIDRRLPNQRATAPGVPIRGPQPRGQPATDRRAGGGYPWPHRRSPSAIPRWTSPAFEVVGLEGRRRSPWPFGPAGMDSTTMRGLLAALRDAGAGRR